MALLMMKSKKKKMMTPLCIPPKMMMLPMPALCLFSAWYEDGQLKLLLLATQLLLMVRTLMTSEASFAYSPWL